MTPEQQSLYEEGRTYFEQGNFDLAEGRFREILKDSPDRFPDVYNKLGIIYYRKDLPDTAIEYFEKALAINPSYTEAALNLAIAYNDLGRYEDAKGVFEKAAKTIHKTRKIKDHYIEGKLANEHARLGDQYYDLGRYREAIIEYRQALRLCPNFVDIILRLGLALRESGNLEDAIKAFSKAQKINPDYLPAYIHMGIIYYMKGFIDMAIKEWQKATTIDPENRDARIYLAFVSKVET